MTIEKGTWIKGSGSYTEFRYRNPQDKKYTENQHDNTGFYEKWGIHATDLAKQENVSTECIHMRVMNYGTPFQRKKNPTLCEQLHHKTDYELGLELNLHPQSVRRRVNTYKNAYRENPRQEHPLRGKIISAKEDWRTNVKKSRFWLMPEHKNYPHEARKGL